VRSWERRIWLILHSRHGVGIQSNASAFRLHPSCVRGLRRRAEGRVARRGAERFPAPTGARFYRPGRSAAKAWVSGTEMDRKPQSGRNNSTPREPSTIDSAAHGEICLGLSGPLEFPFTLIRGSCAPGYRICPLWGPEFVVSELALDQAGSGATRLCSCSPESASLFANRLGTRGFQSELGN